MQLLEELEISGCFFFESCSEIPKCLAVQWQCSVFLAKILKNNVFCWTWIFFFPRYFSYWLLQTWSSMVCSRTEWMFNF